MTYIFQMVLVMFSALVGGCLIYLLVLDFGVWYSSTYMRKVILTDVSV